jgi:predicted secreted protein
MADSFLNQGEGIETGYFAKRKGQFNDEIAKGIKSTGVKAEVQSKKKQPRTNSKKDIEGKETKPVVKKSDDEKDSRE